MTICTPLGLIKKFLHRGTSKHFLTNLLTAVAFRLQSPTKYVLYKMRLFSVKTKCVKNVVTLFIQQKIMGRIYTF